MKFPSLSEYRCDCGKLLFKGSLLLSIIEVKCRRCGKVSVFKGKMKNESLSGLLLADKKRK